jgi:hypothetical protein
MAMTKILFRKISLFKAHSVEVPCILADPSSHALKCRIGFMALIRQKNLRNQFRRSLYGQSATIVEEHQLGPKVAGALASIYVSKIAATIECSAWCHNGFVADRLRPVQKERRLNKDTPT